MAERSPEPERLDAILVEEEDIDYDFEPEPAPYQGSDMEEGPDGDGKPEERPNANSKPEEGPQADSKPEDNPMVPAEASPEVAEAGVQHAEQPTLEASSKKVPAGLRRSSSQADARPARHERLRSEPSRPQSAPRQQSARGSRYFLLKSISLENIEISVAQGIWATQVCSIVCTKLWLPCQSLPSKSAWTPLYHSRAEVLAPGPCLTFSSKCYTEGRVQALISYSQDQKPRRRRFIVGANCSQLFLSCQAQTCISRSGSFKHHQVAKFQFCWCQFLLSAERFSTGLPCCGGHHSLVMEPLLLCSTAPYRHSASPPPPGL